jgi:DNA-binding MarR family transcriptional regulator
MLAELMPRESPATRAAVDALDDFIGYHLRRLSLVVMADLTQALSGLGLKPTAAAILLNLHANPEMTQSDLCKALGILRANMTPLIRTLQRDGLITRAPVDGRSQALRLSPSGRRTCRQARVIMKTHEERLFGSLTPAARRRMLGQLRPLWQRDR